MKFYLALTALLISQPLTATAYELFSRPTMTIKKVRHEIVIRDLVTGEDYIPAAYYGFCKTKNYPIGSDPTGSYSDGRGPYVIIDNKGNILQTLPADGNEGRFHTMFQAYCY